MRHQTRKISKENQDNTNEESSSSSLLQKTNPDVNNEINNDINTEVFQKHLIIDEMKMEVKLLVNSKIYESQKKG